MRNSAGFYLVEGGNNFQASWIERKYASSFSEEARSDFRNLRKEVASLEPGDAAPDELSVYDICCQEPDLAADEDDEDNAGQVVKPEPKTSRNRPCWCGSGKYKNAISIRTSAASKPSQEPFLPYDDCGGHPPACVRRESLCQRRSACACWSYPSCRSTVCADQVVLKNGDSITGAIVKKDGAKLTIKSEFLGEVSMPWAAVKSIKSDADFTVVLPGGESVLGKVNTAGDKLEVVTPTATKSAPLADVSALRNGPEQHSFERLQHPGFLELWTGSYDMGLALARGNARTDSLTNAFNASRITRKDKVTVTFNEIYASARLNGVSNTTASAVRGGWAYNRDITPKFFVSTLNDYEHDRFQNLDLRFVAGGGFGVNAIKKEKANLSFTGGGDYERENFTNNLQRNSGEANFGDDFLYKFSAPPASRGHPASFPNHSPYTGEYRLNFDLAAVTVLKKPFAWHVTTSDRFVSNPVFGRSQRNDLLLSTGFRVSFAK